MKKRFSIPFLVFSLFSTIILAQSKDKKADTITPARQVILKNSGEKNLPQQLKEKQIKEQPAMLKTDSVSATAKPGTKRTKTKYMKPQKKKCS